MTSVTNGSATITATNGSLSATAPVTVSQAAASITLSVDTIRLAAIGDTATVLAEVADAGGAAIERAPVVWSSSDTLVVTVDSTGLVTVVSPGQTSIIATIGSLSGEAGVSAGPLFYLADNGTTVMRPDAEVGDTATVNGVLHTKRDRDGLDP